MKKQKPTKIALMALLVVVVFMATLLGAQVFATFENMTFNATFSPNTISESDSEQTVTLTLTSAEPIDLDGIEYQIVADWEGATIVSTAGVGRGTFTTDDVGQKGGNYYIAWSTEDAENVKESSLGTFKITIPANTAAGNYTVKVLEIETTKNYGNDGYRGRAEATLNIKTKTVDVSSVTLDKTSLSLNVGANATLIATVIPSDATDKTVSWSSNDAKVATVDQNGNITAKAEGSAIITATAGGQSASCYVTVEKDGGGSGPSNQITPAEAKNGSVSVSPESAQKGDVVTVTISPNKGYGLAVLQITDNSGKIVTATQNSDGTYSFIMPEGPVTVTATFVEVDCPSKPFKDVDKNQWYHEYVDYAITNGLMNGVSADKFAPNSTLSRAMLVTILYRIEGQPAVSGANPFSDVAKGSWYEAPVMWASSNGIVSGMGNNKFAPNDNITREQFAAILYRYAQFKGDDVSNQAKITGYSDYASVSDWARIPLGWANAEGLIQGRTSTTLAPKGTATRAEAATILMRFIEGVK